MPQETSTVNNNYILMFMISLHSDQQQNEECWAAIVKPH